MPSPTDRGRANGATRLDPAFAEAQRRPHDDGPAIPYSRGTEARREPLGLPATPVPPDADVEQFKQALLYHLRFTLARYQPSATRRNYYQALVYALRDRLTDAWIRTQKRHYDADAKRVYYLSAEFMMGRLLGTALVNLDLEDACKRALHELGLSLEELNELEWDAGLGAGGLGRLAACFLDSMATLDIPAYGYGIRYEYGIFTQKIENGFQVETPDNWLRYGNPWEIARPERLFPVRFHGAAVFRLDAGGRECHDWEGTERVMAMAYDVPVPGYANGVVNTLRLWSAKSSREFDLDFFNHGDYARAVEEKNRSENITRVLYPRDDFQAGRELRLRQEYFLVSASLQDIVRRYRKTHDSFDRFPDKVAIQLNDTHPALAVPELMRLLLDDGRLSWDKAWEIVVPTFGFTNHTLMAEALECWPVGLMAHLLPRHLEIIFEINRRFLEGVAARHPGDVDRLRRLSLIQEGPEKQVRMAHLAVVGSHAVNGVSRLHSQLLRERVFPDFDAWWPGKFSNKTNGITPRLWLRKANPGLSGLITRYLGPRWATDLAELERLAPLADDGDFRVQWAEVKRHNKRRLAEYVLAQQRVRLSPDSLFDVQTKRVHEYKRQLLNLLHVITLYHRLKDGCADHAVPRTVIFSGKAAPNYHAAKLIVKLVHAVARAVNTDPAVGERLKVAFLPNYSVSLAERIVPAADLSEQISTAGTEASGTGNMKMALNGALTIGTLDGANIEIRDAVGADNVFIFGLTAEQVDALKRDGYRPADYYAAGAELRRTLDAVRDGAFSPEQRDLFRPLVDGLLAADPFLVLADFGPYLAAHGQAEELYRDQAAWTRRSILTVARMGRFSSDRTIREYARDVWGLPV